jgi:hypothetical protein
VAPGKSRRAGDALEAVLRSRDSGAEPGSGRSLLLALLALHDAGVLRFESDDAVHGPQPLAEPGAVGRSGAASLEETAPAYNMGQSNYRGDSE